MTPNRLGGLAALLIALSAPLAWADGPEADMPPPSVEGSAPPAGSEAPAAPPAGGDGAGSASGSAAGSASGSTGEGAAAASGSGAATASASGGEGAAPATGAGSAPASTSEPAPAAEAPPAPAPDRVAFTAPVDIEKQVRACLADAKGAAEHAAQRAARNACLAQKRKLTADFKKGLRDVKGAIAAAKQQIVAGVAACRKAGRTDAIAAIQKWQAALASWVAELQRYGASGGERPAASPPPFPDACGAAK